MTSGAVLWTYALASDVEINPGCGGAFLRTATSLTWVTAEAELEMLQLLAGDGSSEAQIHSQLRLSVPDGDPDASCAALLFRLDRLGLLQRSLISWGRRLVSCVPLRPPPQAPPKHPPEGPLRLSPLAIVRTEGNVVVLESPGSWGRMMIHDRNLLPLLHDLAVDRSAGEVVTAMVSYCEEAILMILALMSWCGLLDQTDVGGWSSHDLLFHTHSRRGYARILLGKTNPEGERAAPLAPDTTVDGMGCLTLDPPDLSRLLAEDPPYAMVSERRQSTRRQGTDPLTSGQLSEFLFRTLHERGGRRPYPSGGSCYPLKTYLAVHRCCGIDPGLYAYDPSLHRLITVSKPGSDLNRLLADAAGAANVAQPPQILLVLAAQYARTQRVYGDLGYSLILKEVGTVFQAAMMAAAAMGLGTCPLGCGNSILFSTLTGIDPLIESSVGEMMVGSFEETV